MNWILIVVIIILAGCAANGHRRGMIKTVFSLFSVVVALILTSVLAPVVSRQLQNNEKLYAYVENKVESSLGGYTEKKVSVTEQTEAIQNLPLPAAIREGLLENKNTEVFKAMAVNSLQEYVTKYVTGMVIQAGAFIIIFLIINIALIITANLLNIISKLPILNGLNKTAGALVGLVQGLLVIWILCIVLTVFSSTEFAKDVFAQINESKVLGFLYNNNLLLKSIANVVKGVL